MTSNPVTARWLPHQRYRHRRSSMRVSPQGNVAPRSSVRGVSRPYLDRYEVIGQDPCVGLATGPRASFRHMNANVVEDPSSHLAWCRTQATWKTSLKLPPKSVPLR